MTDRATDTADRGDTRKSSALGAGLEELGGNWRWLVGLGVVWMALGALAIIVPLGAALAFELLLGGIFAIGGVVQIAQAFRLRNWKGYGMNMLGGSLALALGVLLLVYPFQGVLTLTLFLGAFFIVSGVLQVISALQHRELRNWGWILASGILGMVIGALILTGWPSTAVWAIGILVGIELIVTGWSLLIIGLSARDVS